MRTGGPDNIFSSAGSNVAISTERLWSYVDASFVLERESIETSIHEDRTVLKEETSMWELWMSLSRTICMIY